MTSFLYSWLPLLFSSLKKTTFRSPPKLMNRSIFCHRQAKVNDGQVYIFEKHLILSSYQY